MRILVSRTDRLGDVALTLPLCGLLKARLDATVVFLGRVYTRPLLEASDAVDEVLDWDGVADAPLGVRRDFIRAARADVVLHVLPRAGVAWSALAARVPRRVGTTHRWYHWPTCNVREPLERRASPLHEAQLNVQLARTLLPAADLARGVGELAGWAGLAARVAVPAAVVPLLAPDRFALVVHPGSSGSAGEWPLARWRALVDALAPERFRVLVTGSSAEGDAMRPWLEALPGHAHDLTGRLGLAELIAVLAAAGGIVAASTGPLHVGALLGRHALGLYATVRPVHAGRWGPLGPRAEVVEGDAVAAIPVDAVRARVERWVAAHPGSG
ncbi:MAG TPA: glycosyltransferase family 9 protein [Gemmatirosa sp.]